jgi:hypothetical protein
MTEILLTTTRVSVLLFLVSSMSGKSVKSCLSKLAVCRVLGTLPSDVDDGAI